MTGKSLEKRLRRQAAAESRGFVIGFLLLGAAMAALLCLAGPGFPAADLGSLFRS